MRLVRQEILTSKNKEYGELLELCHLSKNLYNAALYTIRQYYFENKQYLPYVKVDEQFRKEDNIDYRALPTQTAQQTLRAVDAIFKSFFRLLSKKKLGTYKKPINIPHYLDKSGYYVVVFTNQQMIKKNLDAGIIKIPKSSLMFKTEMKDIRQVRFIPRNGYIVMETVYEVKGHEPLPDNGSYAAIDPGVDNLATVTSNVMKPFIINGRPIKSINQYYNKERARLQSEISPKKTSNKIRKITFKRNNKIKDYFHKASRYIVNQLTSNSVNTIIIGRNKGWKQDTDMGHGNNQNFVMIPHYKFIDMISYKCRMLGINVILTNEAYTSKASFLDGDPIPKLSSKKTHVFSGKRIKRGLYRSKDRKLINADVNGSFNIMRNAVGDVVIPADRGFVFNPVRLSF